MRSTTETGKKAERAAATYLEMRGYRIIEQNWRRPLAEIDIVAEKAGVRYFVEVKYRRDYEQGGGLEAVTDSKLRHMRRAAEAYVEEQKWAGEYCLSVVEIAGAQFSVMAFIDNAY